MKRFDHAKYLKEYELSQAMHNHYASQVWQMASFLIGGSIAGFAFILSRLPNILLPIHFNILFLFGILVNVLAFVFFLMLRRHHKIAEVHFIRCRQLESMLGLQQHKMVCEAAEKGIPHDRPDRSGNREIWQVGPPSGWCILKGMSWFIIIFPWILIICLGQK